jgi:membrane AbrB-like protein
VTEEERERPPAKGRNALLSPLPAFVTDTDGPVAPTWKRLAIGLSIGVTGGALFAWIGAPLAWMLGAMIGVTAASLAGARLAVHPVLRTVMVAVLGVMLGASFTPDMLGQMTGWIGAVVLLIGYLAVTLAIAYAYFRSVAGFGQVTSYFSGAPGGLTEMALMGEAKGGDIRVISLIHATRILVVVATIPVYFRVVEGIDVPSLPPGVGIAGIALSDALLLTACAVIGYPLAKVARLPAAALVGPMILSAVIHLKGWSTVPPPVELIAAAQVVVGTAIGARFTGLRFSHVWPYLLVAAGSALLMMAAAVVTAVAFAGLLGMEPAGLILALTPGGLIEMGLIALSLGVDTAFVSTMHVLRITAVVILAPIAFTLMERLRRHSFSDS